MSGGQSAQAGRLQGLARLWILVLVAALLGGCAGQPQRPVANPEFVSPGGPDALETLVRLQTVFKRYEGVPYRYGGATPAGFDCSGFIRAAYREALNRDLPRTTDELAVLGVAVPRDRLQPGDLVFFDTNGSDGHAGIFLGGSRFIHASTTVGVSDSSLDSAYWRAHYSQARRLLPNLE